MADNPSKTTDCQKSPARKICELIVIFSLLVGGAVVARNKGRQLLEKIEKGKFEGGIPSEQFDHATHTFIGARNLGADPHDGQYLLWDSDGNTDTIEAVTQVQGVDGGKLSLTNLVALWEVKPGDKLTGRQIKGLCPTADTTAMVKGQATNTGNRFWILKKDSPTP